MRRTETYYWAAVALVFAFFVLVTVRGIAAPFSWGHDGFTGASFSNAARNSLRHGTVGQAWMHFDREAPKASDLYTHHPMALHAHLVAAFAVFGEHEWAARLVSAAYSIATWCLLFFVVRRYWGGWPALFTGTVYALVPLHMVFANLVNHEPGGIFYCLLLVAGYVRWLERPSWKMAGLVFVALTLAGQFDWPGYYVAFFVAAHLFVSGLRGNGPQGWLVFFCAFCALTLINFFGFFGWIYIQQGSFDDMIGAFRSRSTGFAWSTYLARQSNRIGYLYGVLPVALACAALAVTLVRAAKGRVQVATLIPLAFVFAGLLQAVVFRSAGYMHSFWTFYFGPAVAVGAGLGLERVSAWFNRLVVRSELEGFSVALVLVLFSAIQAPFAIRSWEHGVATGHYAEVRGKTDFQVDETLWFRTLREHFDPTKVEYLLHRSIRDPRIELFYYLDAPHRRVRSLRVKKRSDGPPQVLLFDKAHVADVSGIDKATQGRPTYIWDSRFYAVELADKRAEVHRFVSVDEPMSLTMRWLTTQFGRQTHAWERVP